METADKKVTPEHVRWAYRLFLDREPENDAALLRSAVDTFDLRRQFLQSAEYQAKNLVTDGGNEKWVITSTEFGFRILVSLSEFGVSRPILIGDYEGPTVNLFKKIVRPGAKVIDVGANIGFFSLLFGTLVGEKGRVISFEPVEYLYNAFVQSIEENHFESRCDARRCAVSDVTGRSLIRHAPGTTNFGGGHLATAVSNDNHAYEDVETRRLSEFLDEKRCEVIKIDAEGAELKVLLGAVDLLRRDQPLVCVELFNEQLSRVSQATANDVIRFMADLNYRCQTIGDTAEELRSYDRPEIINVLFSPV